MSEVKETLGPIKLAAGVRKRHVFTYLFAAFVSIGMFTYLIALTPYVLRVNLGLSEEELGRATGDLQFWQEIALLIVIGFWGALSDRIGRRLVYIFGFALLAVAYAAYGFANSILTLTLVRLVFAVGVAATTMSLAAVIADYTDESSRAKLTGIAFLLNGIGSVLFFVGLTQLPELFVSKGASEIWAGRFAYLVAASIAVVAAFIMFGLKKGLPNAQEEKPSPKKLISDGIKAGRNIRIALSYMSAFTARADMSILTLFLTLWIIQAATDTGATAPEAVAKAGMITGLAQIAAVIWAPLFGIIGDKIDKLTLLIAGFAISTIGYGWIASTDDILSPYAIPALFCMGMGLSSAQLASTVLLAEESPEHIRGSVFGLQAWFGALGILALSVIGGRLFDAIGPEAPFVAVALCNFAVLACALIQRGIELRGFQIGYQRSDL